MKIWITRSSARSIQTVVLNDYLYGLETCLISEWRYSGSIETPFGDYSEKHGGLLEKWEIRESGSCWIESSISFGKFIWLL